MNWRNVGLIFRREVIDQLRDRRTLFMIAVLPLFGCSSETQSPQLKDEAISNATPKQESRSENLSPVESDTPPSLLSLRTLHGWGATDDAWIFSGSDAKSLKILTIIEKGGEELARADMQLKWSHDGTVAQGVVISSLRSGEIFGSENEFVPNVAFHLIADTSIDGRGIVGGSPFSVPSPIKMRSARAFVTGVPPGRFLLACAVFYTESEEELVENAKSLETLVSAISPDVISAKTWLEWEVWSDDEQDKADRAPSRQDQN